MLKGFAYFLSWLPPLIAAGGNFLGGGWAGSLGIFMTLLAAADWLWRKRNAPDAWPAVPEVVVLGQLPLQILAWGTLLAGAANGKLAGLALGQAIISTGMSSGVGLTVGHELVHRRERIFHLAGLAVYTVNFFGHFVIEHLHGHHRNVATGEDVDTAPRGVSYYRHLPRQITGQFRMALQLEADRLRAAAKSPWGPGNFVIAVTGLEILFYAGLGVALGVVPLVAMLAQAGVARVFYQAGAYTQHYGLTRRPDERIDEPHSWESNSVISRAMLVENFRHADHHCHVARSCAELQHCPRAPELPAGAIGLFAVVMIPPLWFAVANRRLEHFRRASGGQSN
ncbi:MAG: fatty acid desaturase [Verrucomicrobia bacterium]|nr:fatty acid desaturase [Verrucomicrobiota bacterium]